MSPQITQISQSNLRLQVFVQFRVASWIAAFIIRTRSTKSHETSLSFQLK